MNLEQFALLTPLAFRVKYSPRMVPNICFLYRYFTLNSRRPFVNERKKRVVFVIGMFQSITSASVSFFLFLFFFFTAWRMHDMIDDLSRLSPIQKPSLNSRAAIVCGMSPIDLSSIFS